MLFYGIPRFVVMPLW